MKTHTLENLVERNAAVVLSPVQFVGKDAELDKKPIQIGDSINLKTQDDVTIQVTVVESIIAGKLVGRISSICGGADERNEYMGIKENELLAFEDRHVLDFARK